MTVYTFSTFDDPLAPGNTAASGISGTGLIVGTYSDASGNHGFLLSGGVFIPIDDPSADGPHGGTSAAGVNGGKVVGSFIDASGVEHAFLDSGGTFTTIDPHAAGGPNATSAQAFGINAAGDIVGGFQGTAPGGSPGNFGFLLHGGTYNTFDFGSTTVATDINDTGLIVGTYSDASGNHGFLFNPADPFNIIHIDHPLATNGTLLWGINNAGQIVGTYNTSTGPHSFLYSGGFFTTIDDPVNGFTSAQGINNNGQIVGDLAVTAPATASLSRRWRTRRRLPARPPI